MINVGLTIFLRFSLLSESVLMTYIQPNTLRTMDDSFDGYSEKNHERLTPVTGTASTRLVLTAFMVILNGSSSWCLGRAAVCDCGSRPLPTPNPSPSPGLFSYLFLFF